MKTSLGQKVWILKKSEKNKENLKALTESPQTIMSQKTTFEIKKKTGTPKTDTCKIRVKTENWKSQRSRRNFK